MTTPTVTFYEGKYRIVQQGNTWSCSCPDSYYRHRVCKNIRQVLRERAAAKGYLVSFHNSREAALRQHRPFRSLGRGTYMSWHRVFPQRQHEALLALARQDHAAMLDWLRKYAPDFVHASVDDPENAVIYLSLAASASPFKPNNAACAALRTIGAYSFTPARAAEVARWVLKHREFPSQ